MKGFDLPWVTGEPTLIHAFDQPIGSYATTGSNSATAFSIETSPTTLVGRHSIRVKSEATAGSQYCQCIFDTSAAPLDMSASDLIHVRMAFEDGTLGVDRAAGDKVRFIFSNTEGFVDYAWNGSFWAQNASGEKPPWYIASFPKSYLTEPGGTVDWSDIQRLAFRVGNGFGDFDADVTFDSVWLGGTCEYLPVYLSFDDNDIEVYTTAYPIMKAAGFTATLFINPGTIGGTGKMTWAQVKELEAAGWRLAHHTNDHVAAISIGESESIADYQEGRTNTILEGVRFKEHYAYPNGQYTQGVIDALQADGIRTARIASAGFGGSPENRGYSALFDITGQPIPWTIPTANFNSESAAYGTASLMLAELDKARTELRAFGMYGHEIVASPDTSTRQYATAEFQSVIDGLVTRQNATDGLTKIKVMRYDEYASLFSGHGKTWVRDENQKRAGWGTLG